MNFLGRKKTVAVPMDVNGSVRFTEKGKLTNVTSRRSERQDVILIDGAKYYREDFAVGLTLNTLTEFVNVIAEESGKHHSGELQDPTLLETELKLIELIKSNAPEEAVKAAFLNMGAAKGRADALKTFDQRKDMQEQLERVAALEADAGIICEGV